MILMISTVDELIANHELLWEDSTRVVGKVSPEVMAEIRRDGEPRLGLAHAASLLRTHDGLAAWAQHNGGGVWNFELATEAVAARLTKQSEQDEQRTLQTQPAATATASPSSLPLVSLHKLKRADWMALLELCLTADACLASCCLGRADFTKWPPAIERLVNLENGEESATSASGTSQSCSGSSSSSSGSGLIACSDSGTRKWPIAPLTVLCARFIAREPLTFFPGNGVDNNTRDQQQQQATAEATQTDQEKGRPTTAAQLVARFGSGAVIFHPGRIAPHDPSPSWPPPSTAVNPAGGKAAAAEADDTAAVAEAASKITCGGGGVGREQEAGVGREVNRCAVAIVNRRRVAEWSMTWPHRVFKLGGNPRLVRQALPGAKLGTGAHVWGGALALCEELERRNSASAASTNATAAAVASVASTSTDTTTTTTTTTSSSSSSSRHVASLSPFSSSPSCPPSSSSSIGEDKEARGREGLPGRSPRGLRVLELGAGQGIGSLCAALLGASKIVSTDLAPTDPAAAPSLLDLIASNRDTHASAILSAHLSSHQAAAAALDDNACGVSNKPGLLPEQTQTACQKAAAVAAAAATATATATAANVWSVRPLWWGDAVQAQEALQFLGGGCDLVLASECAYDSSSFDALLATLDLLCHRASGGNSSTSNSSTSSTSSMSISSTDENGKEHPREDPREGVPPRAAAAESSSLLPPATEVAPTEVLMCHYPRTQAGGSVPELDTFVALAVDRGFQVRTATVVGQATGVSYLLHSLTKL